MYCTRFQYAVGLREKLEGYEGRVGLITSSWVRKGCTAFERSVGDICESTHAQRVHLEYAGEDKGPTYRWHFNPTSRVTLRMS